MAILVLGEVRFEHFLVLLEKELLLLHAEAGGVPEIEDGKGQHHQEDHQERHPVDADDAKCLPGGILLLGGRLLDRLAERGVIEEEGAEEHAGEEEEDNRADKPGAEIAAKDRPAARAAFLHGSERPAASAFGER